MTPQSEPIVGIDLGTTNSLVAVVGWMAPDGGGGGGGGGGGVRVLADEQGRMLLPSVVRFQPDGGTGQTGGDVVVGWEAREGALDHARETISSVKRLMGRSLEDARGDVKYLSYEVVEGENRTARVRLPWGRVVSPPEVSAHVLRALKARAERALATTVTKAVITVPAYFDDAQRQATRDAGRLAGLEVVRIINEPTAAALAYGVGMSGGGGGGTGGAGGEGGAGGMTAQNIVVYDFGGGTFDVSVLRLIPGDGGDSDCFHVLSTAGDVHLGGDDIDHLLMGVFTDEMNELFGAGATIEFPPEARRALVEFARSAKERLSAATSASVLVDLGTDGAGRARRYERSISRAEFEALIAPLVDRTIACCERALRDARDALGGEPISCVVMVGGSTRIPLVNRRVGEFFSLEPYTALDPDQVVAIGAAVQAGILAGRRSGERAERAGALLLDVVPLSLGIETVGGAAAKLVMRNSGAPARASEMFSTSVDNQTSIRLHVVQGEREMAADCRSLGVFNLSGLPPMPAGIPKVRVTFAVDVNGVLNVSAVEERSGKRAALQVVPNHGLSREEVERIERESFAHAREDMTRHRVVDLVANSKLDLHWIGKQISRLGSDLEPEYRRELEASVESLAALVGRAEADWRAVDPDELHRAKDSLDRASMRMHEISIARSLRAETNDQGGGKGAGP